MFNNEIVKCVDKYKYLVIILHEHLNFNNTAAVLAGSLNTALGCTLNLIN